MAVKLGYTKVFRDPLGFPARQERGLPTASAPLGLAAAGPAAPAGGLNGWALIGTMAGVFLGGLALNLTPCVYPLIPITVSYFGGQSGRGRGTLLLHGLCYLLGLAVTISALGVAAALTGGLMGALLQNPLVLMVVAHAARTVYDVPIVVARNYDPNLRPIIEVFGLQTVGSTYWGAQRVEELLINPTQRAVYSAGNGEVEVYEVQVPDTWNGRTLHDLLAPLKDCYPVALSRAGRSSLPEGNLKLQTDDLLNVSSTSEGISALTARLSGKVEA